MSEDVKVWGARIGLWACGMFVVPAAWWWLQGNPDHPAAGYVTLAIVLTGPLTFFSVLVTIAAVFFGPGLLAHRLPAARAGTGAGAGPATRAQVHLCAGRGHEAVDCGLRSARLRH